MKKIISLLLLMTAFVACSDSDDAPQSIVLDKGTQTQQTIYADQTTNGKGITFHASEAWTATITDTTRAAAEWIRLSQYSGEAGSYTLTLTIDENTTGKDRTAEIRIEAGSSVITITISQKGITKEEEDNTKPEPEQPTAQKVSKISIYTMPIDADPADKTEDQFEMSVSYNYDSEGRITKVEIIEMEYTELPPNPNYAVRAGREPDFCDDTFEYLTAGDGHKYIKISRYYHDGEGEERSFEEIHLDKTGKAYDLRYNGGNEQGTIFVYNANNELIKTTTDLGSGYNNSRKMLWQNGNIVRCTWELSSYDPVVYTMEYNTELENNANIDLANYICFFLCGGEATAFMHETEVGNMLDCFGKRTKNMPSRLIGYYGARFDYTTNAQGQIIGITVTEDEENPNLTNEEKAWVSIEYK